MTKADAKRHVCYHIAANLAGELRSLRGNATLSAWMLPPETPEEDAERIFKAIDEIIEEMKRRAGVKEERIK